MLAITGRVAPPGIVGDDGEDARPFPDIAGAVFPVNGFIADGAADRNVAAGGPDGQEGDFLLSDAAAHHAAEHVVDLREEGGVRGLFHADDEFRFVEKVAAAGPVEDQGGVVGFHPAAVAEAARRHGRAGRAGEILPGGGPEEQVGRRMRLEERKEGLVGRTFRNGVGDDVSREGFRSQQENGGQGVTAVQGLFELLAEDGVLLGLRHPAEFVVRVDIGLGDNHFQLFPVRPAAVPDDGGSGHRRKQDQHGGGDGGDARLAVPAAPAPVGERDHQPEQGQVHGPDPEGAAEGAGVLVPLDKAGRPGEGVAEHEPRPGDLGKGQVPALPRDPCGSEEKIGEDPTLAPLDPAEGAEYQRHLERVGQDGENASADRGVADPEGRHGIPEDEGAVMPPPETAHPRLRGDPFQAEQRDQPDEGRPAETVHEEGEAHQDREEDHEEKGKAQLSFHNGKDMN